jgi:hypothetical protein
MANETTKQIQEMRNSPAYEADQIALRNNARNLVNQNLGAGVTPSKYKISGFSGMQNQGFDLAKSGIGVYQPYLESGDASIQGGMNAITGAALPIMENAYGYAGDQQGRYDSYRDDSLSQYGNAVSGGQGYIDQGAAGLQGTGAAFDPTTTSQFMNPYETGAVQQALADLQRQGDIQAMQGNAAAVGAGAFGGARSGVQSAEMNRNLLDAQSRTAGNMRMAGYNNALQSAQAAFEASQGRRMQGAGMLANMGTAYGNLGNQTAQGIGNLGVNFGNLDIANTNQMANIGQASAGIGGQLANMGVQRANLGDMFSTLNLRDVNTLMTLGGQQQKLDQNINDARRINEENAQNYPYRNFSWLGDVYKSNPGSTQNITTQTTSGASPFQEIAGYGLGALTAAAGARQANLF